MSRETFFARFYLFFVRINKFFQRFQFLYCKSVRGSYALMVHLGNGFFVLRKEIFLTNHSHATWVQKCFLSKIQEKPENNGVMGPIMSISFFFFFLKCCNLVKCCATTTFRCLLVRAVTKRHNIFT